MFSRLLKRINFRLAAIFSALFIVTSLTLFSAIYVILSTSLRREDHEFVRLKLLELWAQYRIGGVDRLRGEVTLEKVLGEKKVFLVRVADPWNNTLFILAPGLLLGSDIERLKGAALRGEVALIPISVHGEKWDIEVGTLGLSDGSLLQVGITISERERVLKRFREIFGLTMFPLVVLGFLGGALLSNRSLSPIQRLIDTIRAMLGTGKIRERVPSTGRGDELDQLVSLFNKMLEKIELLVNGMRGALDTVAHDLRTPMARLRGTAEGALRGPASIEEYREALAECMEESEQILTMLNSLMDISEAETGVIRLNKKMTDLAPLILDIAELYSYVAEEKNIGVVTNVPGEFTVPVDASRLRQVIANLLDNAVKYTPEGGRVTIEAGIREGRAFIAVEDTGMGIEEHELPSIWERLYRGVQSRSNPGLGLGLSFVKAIVRSHGGDVAVSSEPGRGSRFSIFLPIGY